MKPKRLGSAIIAILSFENGFLNLNKMTTPNELQCHVCGEIARIYHPSSLS